MLLLVFPVLPLQAEDRLSLSPRQETWLQEHPVIVVGLYDKGWPPYESIEAGRPQGLGYDYLRELATRLGVELRTRTYSDWTDMLDDACAGELDVVMNLALTAERTRCLVFTRQYAEAPIALIGKPQDARLAANPELEGLRLITDRNFATSRAARERYPEAQHLEVDDTVEALRMVSSGAADAYLGNPHVASALIAERHLTRVALVRPTDLPVDTLHFAVPNGKAPLAEALDDALASIPEAQGRAMRTRWLRPLQWEGSGLILSEAEKAALVQPLRLGFAPNWAPISFIDEDGQPSGLVGEYLRRFRALGANLQMVDVEDWQGIRDGALSGELDAIMGVPEDVPWLGDEWVFSQPFLTVANVIVTRQGSEGVLDPGDLDGQAIALSNPDRLGPPILAQAPRVRIVPARGAEQGLEMLRDGQVDAYVGNLAAIDRFLRDRYSGELYIAAPAGIEDRLAFGVHRRHAPLATAFDRMLLSLSPREREAIRSDWLAVEYRSGLQWRTALRWAVPILLVLLTAGLVHGLGHWRLRREVEERRRVEKRLDEVTSNLPAVVYQARRETDGTIVFPFIVGDMPSLFGLSAERAMGDERELFARVHPEDQSRLVAAMAHSVNDFAPIDVEFRGLSVDGGWRWVRSRGLPHRAEDGAFLWSGYWIDVTQAHEQADELAAAKTVAERAAAAKADFLATMSHEIRTPMSGVLGMLEMLAHTELDAEQRRVLASIDESAQMLRQILDDILDVSKMEAGALLLAPVPVSLRRIIDNVQQMLTPQASAKGLRFEARVGEGVAEAHGADGVRLRQILFNLISNAIKFTERGRVEVALDLLENLGDRQTLRLAVTDTGIGIAPDRQAHLFRPFSQAETSTTRRYGGTGLGLSICRRLVDMMGGELRLSSVPGEGTRVETVLVLPLADPGAVDAGVAGLAAEPAYTGDPEGWRGCRVLVVEDHPTNQVLMQWRMSQFGIDCELADDGITALEALRRSRFDLVITDCRMPGMDGYALTREIRRREAECGEPRLPVIALTASALQEEAERCRAAGMDDFMAKPVPLATLHQVLVRWLPRNGGCDEAAAATADASASASASALASASAPTSASASASASGPAAPAPASGIRQELMRRYGSAEVVAQLAASLVAATRDDLDGIRSALAQDDADAVHQRLHRIAGGIGVAGAQALAQRTSDLMDAIDRDGTETHRNALVRHMGEIEGFVDELARDAI
ncbi:ATP-binding protein [Luteimonas sp. R10]|uniref:ATP-binding protein n=1 Tax=Luteimonas sp. R10 TaxID=3108176 RepID=UPI00308F6FD9|nr:transporter substrate-binding domain-containing protein [Luteimonas sp. R10]